jgi:hypothetical protein
LFVESSDSFDGSNFPSLLPEDPFSEFGFLPFLPFFDNEDEDETTPTRCLLEATRESWSRQNYHWTLQTV